MATTTDTATAAAGEVEREVKLQADLALDLPDLRDVIERSVRQPSVDLRTAYFDTPDFRLWRRGITLRHRISGPPGDSDLGVWTVKLPAPRRGAALARTELQWPGTRDEMPGEVGALLRGLVRRAQLEELVELRTTRRRLSLSDRDASAELDDDVVTVVGGARDGLRFRQLELEFAPGGERVVDRARRALRRAGARPDDRPKLARALGLDPPGRGGPAGGARRGQLGKGSTLADVVGASIDDALRRLLDHDTALRLGGDHPAPEDVHQARVATRRLRSDLKTFRALLDPVWLDHTRAELEWFGTVLGQVRDIDVLSGNLADDGHLPGGTATDAAGAAELRAALVEERRGAARHLALALTQDRYIDLLDRLDAAARTPPFYERHAGGGRRPGRADRPAVGELPGVLHRRCTALRRRVRRAGPHPSDGELHRIRIGAKQLRYAAEAATPVMGRAARRTAEAAERLQRVLGDHHDAVAAEHWLRAHARDASPAASFVAGRLAGDQERRRRRLRRRWRGALARLEATTSNWSS
jgi:CHAD domain-containing protein